MYAYIVSNCTQGASYRCIRSKWHKKNVFFFFYLRSKKEDKDWQKVEKETTEIEKQTHNKSKNLSDSWQISAEHQQMKGLGSCCRCSLRWNLLEKWKKLWWTKQTSVTCCSLVRSRPFIYLFVFLTPFWSPNSYRHALR